MHYRCLWQLILLPLSHFVCAMVPSVKMGEKRRLTQPIGFGQCAGVQIRGQLRRINRLAYGLILILFASGCSDFFGESAKQPPPAAQVQGPPTSGKVLDAKRAGGYTYMQLEHKGKKFWIASSIINVQRNNIVSWKGAYVMNNYKSAALRKQFDEIYFVSSIKIEK